MTVNWEMYFIFEGLIFFIVANVFKQQHDWTGNESVIYFCCFLHFLQGVWGKTCSSGNQPLVTKVTKVSNTSLIPLNGLCQLPESGVHSRLSEHLQAAILLLPLKQAQLSTHFSWRLKCCQRFKPDYKQRAKYAAWAVFIE